MHVDIAADGGDRGQLAQLVQNQRIAHVAGVEDMAQLRAEPREPPAGEGRAYLK